MLNVYIINSIAKSYILNIKISPLVPKYALLKRTSVTRGLILIFKNFD